MDPKHELADVLQQLDFNGPCGGFIHDFSLNYPDKKASAPQVMAYFDRQGPNRLPVLHTLAESFTLCDHWFSSVPGPTWPNRFFRPQRHFRWLGPHAVAVQPLAQVWPGHAL